MSSIDILEADVETNISSFLVGDVAISFDTQTIVDIENDFVSNKTISKIEINLILNIFYRLSKLLDFLIIFRCIVVNENFNWFAAF